MVGLSPKWTITPVGGADKVPTFVALLGAQRGLNLATLIDIQNKDRQKVENLYKGKLLKKKQVLTFSSYCGKAEADIEDMFDPEFYVRVVNAEYDQVLQKQLSATDVVHQSEKRRVLVVIEEHFLKAPLVGVIFNHYRPARYFSENIATLEKDLSAATLERFEKVFKALNDLL